jgi:hypothetical protein
MGIHLNQGIFQAILELSIHSWRLYSALIKVSGFALPARLCLLDFFCRQRSLGDHSRADGSAGPELSKAMKIERYHVRDTFAF